MCQNIFSVARFIALAAEIESSRKVTLSSIITTVSFTSQDDYILIEHVYLGLNLYDAIMCSNDIVILIQLFEEY